MYILLSKKLIIKKMFFDLTSSEIGITVWTKVMKLAVTNKSISFKFGSKKHFLSVDQCLYIYIRHWSF